MSILTKISIPPPPPPPPFSCIQHVFFSVPKRNICCEESEALKFIISKMGGPFQVITHNQSYNYVNIANSDLTNCQKSPIGGKIGQN